ncbi:MAG: LytTR family transcriptional regulator [Phaeodactylibacter sp.]|nr:LytTR family transcriptional regulator [Phaeodactylibacter sp.]MCB9273049.1 LytTR family transcriptional regulator [Lewinellaceae bacterium]
MKIMNMRPAASSFSVHPNRRRQAQAMRKIALPTLDGFIFKRVEQIIFLEADGNYTALHFSDGSRSLICKTLQHTEELLGAYPQFIRVHRSYTINLNHLERYVRGKGGHVVLEDGRTVSVSNGKKADFLKALELYFGHL